MKTIEVPKIGIVEFPDTMSDDEISGKIQQTLKEMYPPMTAGEFTLKTLQNIPGSGVQAGKNLWQAIRHPIQTATAVGTLVGQATKIATAPKGEAGKVQAPEFDAFMQFMANRYGTMDKLKNTVMTDPIGFALDVSTITGTGGASLPGRAGEIAGTVSKVADPIMQAKNVAKTALFALPKSLPETLYTKSLKLNITKKLTPEVKTQIIETGLKEGIVVSNNGLDKLYKTTNLLENQVDQIIKSQPGLTIDPIKVADRLEQLKEFYKYTTVPGPYIDQIDLLKKQFIASNTTSISKEVTETVPFLNKAGQPFVDATGNPLTRQVTKIVTSDGPVRQIPVEEAQLIKKTTYVLVRKHYGELSTLAFEGQKSLARGMKEELVNKFPELRSLNERDSRIIDLGQQLEKVVSKIENKDLVGFYGAMGIGAGAMAGAGFALVGEEAALGGIARYGISAALAKWLIDNPKIQSKIAIKLKNARQAGIYNLNRTKKTIAMQAGVQIGKIPTMIQPTQEQTTQSKPQ